MYRCLLLLMESRSRLQILTIGAVTRQNVPLLDYLGDVYQIALG